MKRLLFTVIFLGCADQYCMTKLPKSFSDLERVGENSWHSGKLVRSKSDLGKKIFIKQLLNGLAQEDIQREFTQKIIRKANSVPNLQTSN